jgi:hypothetical protein
MAILFCDDKGEAIEFFIQKDLPEDVQNELREDVQHELREDVQHELREDVQHELRWNWRYVQCMLTQLV